VFTGLDVDAFFLEYDTERAGGFEPLRHVPKGKTVVLGLVSSKVAELEKKDELKRRIDAAAKYVPLENLCLSPQCGFSSTHHGNSSLPTTSAEARVGPGSIEERLGLTETGTDHGFPAAAELLS